MWSSWWQRRWADKTKMIKILVIKKIVLSLRQTIHPLACAFARSHSHSHVRTVTPTLARSPPRSHGHPHARSFTPSLTHARISLYAFPDYMWIKHTSSCREFQQQCMHLWLDYLTVCGSTPLSLLVNCLLPWTHLRKGRKSFRILGLDELHYAVKSNVLPSLVPGSIETVFWNRPRLTRVFRPL